MNAPARMAAFAAALGVVFGAAALAGASLDPLRDGDEPEPAGHGEAAPHAVASAAADEAPGLALSEGGLRLELAERTLPLDRAARLSFRIVGADGEPVEDFDVEHERRMHLIVVRRDLTGFQHLHPTLGPGGRWSADLRLPRAGAYRAYADFSAGGRGYTLSADVAVAGAFRPEPLPPVRAAEAADGYSVALDAHDVRGGADAELAYAVSRDGRPVRDVEPYLGADGHLVALREGDLAFLHVHPEESHGGDGRIRFRAELPSAGRYRLFLQFRHGGAVHTVAHTVEATR